MSVSLKIPGFLCLILSDFCFVLHEIFIPIRCDASSCWRKHSIRYLFQILSYLIRMDLLMNYILTFPGDFCGYTMRVPEDFEPACESNTSDSPAEYMKWTVPDETQTIYPDSLRTELLHPHEAVLTAFATEHRIPSQGYAFTLGRAAKFQPQKARELGIPVNMWGTLQKGNSVQVGEQTILPEQVLGKARKGLKFVISGDTASCESLITAAEGADLLICESTYGENGQAQMAIDHGHMNFAQAAEVAARAGAKELWLAHYSQQIEDPETYLPNAAVNFENTVCGKDGMAKTLRFED